MLPKVTHPKFEVPLPSNGVKVSLRPFLVHEEKILLMAKAGKDIGQIMTSVKQIVQSCCLTKGFNVEDLPIFDLEFLYIKLVAASVSNIKTLTFRDNEDGEVYRFEIDLNTVQIEFPEKAAPKKIQISETVGIMMTMPKASIFSDQKFLKAGEGAIMELALKCIDFIYEGDKIFKTSVADPVELQEFMDSLDMKVYDQIKEFLFSVPKLRHVITYKNKAGNDRRIELTTLDDFFTFR